MLLRLRIRGFKNLRDVEVRFGPLTCFVGPNGVGKSNIFDAIQFLRHLADQEIHRAADMVRSPASGTFDPLELFWNKDPTGTMSFEADMIVPSVVTDDLGQNTRATTTLLRYGVSFRCAVEPRPRLELASEELTHHKKGQAERVIGFEHAPQFRASVVIGKRPGGAFISTRSDSETARVELHGDGGSRGRAVTAGPSPRTVLGGTGTAQYPTVVAARREMSSWRALHLEPSSLRTPDRFDAPAHVDEHGAHIAATLHHLSRADNPRGRTFAEAANRLARLVPDVLDLRVERDETREQHVVQVRMRGSTLWLPPRALSDGTLRFLALVTMQMDAEANQVLCIEEPENGIHPSKTPQVVDLLRDYAVDPDLEVAEDNPLRQVVLNTHSPDVLRRLDAPEVLFVDSVSNRDGRSARVRPIRAEGNWRGDSDAISAQALKRLIGGAPICKALKDRQFEFAFGTAE